MILETETSLYRYDLNSPPEEWRNDFFNFEHEYDGVGAKNKAGLFFFADSEIMAKQLAHFAALEHNRHSYYLTNTHTTIPLKLIDFKGCGSIYQMLDVLHTIGADVLTPQFQMFQEAKTFALLKELFETALNEPYLEKKYMLIKQLEVHFKSKRSPVGLFGQRLTDFDNGIHFKELISSVDSTIDGYRWPEFEQDSFTYCLFDNEKLGQKETTLLYL